MEQDTTLLEEEKATDMPAEVKDQDTPCSMIPPPPPIIPSPLIFEQLMQQEEQQIQTQQEPTMDAETRDLMHAQVVQSTRKNYKDAIIQLMNFLFDKCTVFPNIITSNLM